MAEPGSTSKGSGLKGSFAEFDKLHELVGEVNANLDVINRGNLHVGGDDEIGKQYHQQVDEGTQILTELVTRIQTSMGRFYEGGATYSDALDRADEDGTKTINSKL
ncbi:MULTISPECIES: hypothetical protein [Kitasatospora]|uniref:Uncharacterized protein n=1 Tax=Kitasatospora setae (strain ATCC 33774 / DSM 43861 / JCM 3304 / KCC A-0304 / NBRC 14216 / KM-6054) TaxID=452652 RepID=E4MYW0_KITSK|nr:MULTISPECIES: hypothetical protein [Kitasatospora]BAJ32732.1 hypothetical protein KSE_69740 [Kitasatospora setae KM-6054]